MSNGLTEIAYLCRELSIKKDGSYMAVCDYYGTLDSVQVVVIDRKIPWAEVEDYVITADIRLSNQPEIDAVIKKLKGLL
tara:strand:+ start:1402 stop:1638 length:237 start_codon:yes stop_codon:yes gene_type:complete